VGRRPGRRNKRKLELLGKRRQTGIYGQYNRRLCHKTKSEGKRGDENPPRGYRVRTDLQARDIRTASPEERNCAVRRQSSLGKFVSGKLLLVLPLLALPALVPPVVLLLLLWLLAVVLEETAAPAVAAGAATVSCSEAAEEETTTDSGGDAAAIAFPIQIILLCAGSNQGLRILVLK